MEIKIIKEEDFLNKISIKMIIISIDKCFKSLGNNNVNLPERISFYKSSEKESGYFNLIMPAVLDDNPGMKFLIDWLPKGKTTGNKSSVIIYPKKDSLFILESNRLTDLRTGASAALCIQYLIKSPKRIAVSGAGRIGKAVIECCNELFPKSEIIVYDPSTEALNSIPQKVIIAKSKQELIENSDAWVLAIPTSDPIIKKEDLKIFKGNLIITLTGDPKVQLIENDALRLLEVIVDKKEQCLKQGQLRLNPYSKIIGTIGDASLNKIQIKNKTLFDSTGLAIQDVALGKLASENF